MAVDERARHRLYQRLEEVLGPEEARALMQHLPPAGWADVATKLDLRDLESRMDLKLDSTKNELLATFRAELVRQTHTMVYVNAGTVLAVAGLAFAAARLA